MYEIKPFWIGFTATVFWIWFRRNDRIAIYKVLIWIFYFDHTLQTEQFIPTTTKHGQSDNSKIHTKTMEYEMKKSQQIQEKMI